MALHIPWNRRELLQCNIAISYNLEPAVVLSNAEWGSGMSPASDIR